MPPPNVASSTAITNATVVTNAETVVCTLPNVITPFGGLLIKFLAFVNISLAASTTSLRLRIRRDSLTGTAIFDSGAITAGIAASTLANVLAGGQDQPGEVAATYVLTVQTVGAAANHTVNATQLQAIIGG